MPTLAAVLIYAAAGRATRRTAHGLRTGRVAGRARHHVCRHAPATGRRGGRDRRRALAAAPAQPRGARPPRGRLVPLADGRFGGARAARLAPRRDAPRGVRQPAVRRRAHAASPLPDPTGADRPPSSCGCAAEWRWARRSWSSSRATRQLGATGGRMYLSGVDPNLVAQLQRTRTGTRRAGSERPVRIFEASELVGGSTEEAVEVAREFVRSPHRQWARELPTGISPLLDDARRCRLIEGCGKPSRRRGTMAIGPVQLIVLGFKHPEFHGEIIAELERLRESDTVRVIDALAVYKDTAGEFEVEHLSNLTEDEAIELGSKVGALVGLGIEGEEGMAAGALAGAEAAADGVKVFSDEDAWDVLEDIPNDSAAALHPDRAPLGGAAARRRHARGRLPHLRRLHQPARPRRDRPGHRRGGRAAARPGDRRRGRTTDRPPPTQETRHVRITQSRTTYRPPHRAPRLTTPIGVLTCQSGERRSATPVPGIPEAPVGFHLLAKPTGAICNLDCKYCFFLSKEMLYPGDRFRMADDVLETYIRQLLESHARRPEVNVAWQGGEPTLMGLDFFRRSVELVEQHRSRASASTTRSRPTARCSTTSGARSSSEHDFLVGTQHRRPARAARRLPRRQGRRRHASTRSCAGSKLLRRRGVDVQHPVHRPRRQRGSRRSRCTASSATSCGASSSSSSRSSSGPRRALPMATVGGVRARPSAVHAGGDRVTERSVGAERYGRFLIDVFDEWVRRDVGKVFVQMFDVALGELARRAAEPVHLLARRAGTRSRSSTTATSTRATTSSSRSYLLGNIRETHMVELVASPQQRAFGRAKRDTLPEYCRECDVRFACHGECPKNRFIDDARRRARAQLPVPGYKRFFHHIDEPMSGWRSCSTGPRARRDHAPLRRRGRGSRPQRAVHLRQRAQVEALSRDRADGMTRTAPAADASRARRWSR